VSQVQFLQGVPSYNFSVMTICFLNPEGVRDSIPAGSTIFHL
jgi:hypothetical protein